jgi:VCBS repeat-containing protein
MAISNFKAPTFTVTELPSVTGSLAVDTVVATTTFSDTAAPTFKVTNNSSNAPGGVFLGSLTAGAVSFNAGAGSVGWTFAVADNALDFLAAGQTVVEKFNVTITESNGSTSTQTIQVTLTGTNDTPTIVAAATTATGSIQEVLPVTANPIATNGTISFKDADFTDTHTVSFTPAGAGFLGTFTATRGADSLNGATGTVGWTFSVPDNAVGVNQTVVQTYHVKITDASGAVATQDVTVTIHGHPDAPPVITSTAAAATGTVIETAAQSGVATPHTASGTITYTDPDAADTHTVALVATPPGALGTFALGAAKDTVNGLGGSVPWSFSVPDNALDFLALNEQRVQTYTIRITDIGGAFTDQVVTVTMTGTNDAPVITSTAAAATGAITEAAGVTASPALDAATGTLTFKDVDLIDTHSVTVTAGTPAAGAHAYVGGLATTLTDSTGTGAGSLGWSFSAPDSALDFLAAGQTQVQTYTVAVNDGHGGIASQVVTVTLTGTNDAPVITSTAAAASATVTELANTTNAPAAIVDTASGTLTYSDPDLTDSHTVSFAAAAPAVGAPAYIGTFALGTVTDSTGTGSGSIGWTFSVPDHALDFLSAGQTLTQIYNVTVADGHGGTIVQPVTVTLTGTNDAPVAQALTGNASNLAPAIDIAPIYSDPDLLDTHTITVGATTNGGLATVNPDGTIHYSTNNAFSGFVGTDSFTYTVTDNHGAVSTQTVSIAVSFDNLPTILAGGSLAGSVTANPGSALPDTTSGNILFSDIDVGQTHVGSIVGAVSMIGSAGVVLPAAPVGSVTFAAASPDSSGGSTGAMLWTYSAPNSAVAFLAAGQSLTETFTAQIDDLHGGKVTAPLTITILGANDAPVITAATTTAAGSVAELANTTGSLVADTATGSIGFTDPDLIDTHTVSVSPVAQASGYVGTLTAGLVTDSTGGAAGSVGWTFSAPDNALDFLGANQTLVQNYNVTVDDGHGGTAVQQVAVTLVGANDAPVATAITATTANNAALTLAANYTDPDLIDSHTVAVTANAAHGTVINNGNESFTYIANAGFVGNDTFSYQVTDNNGAVSAVTPVTVTVTGAAPPPPPPANPDGLVNDHWVVTQGTLANQHIVGFSADAVLGNDPVALHPGLHVISVAGADVSFNAASNTITYTPPGTAIADSFTYTTSDNAGNISTATVNVQQWDGTSATSVGSATNQAEWLIGTSTSAVTLTGSAGADNLHVGTGGGTIIGGGGADTINTLNGANPAVGATHFVYGVVGHNTGNVDSSLGAMDTISGFQHGLDSIDLKGFGIAANSAITAVDVTPFAGGQNGFTSASVAGYFTAAGPGAGNSVVSEIDRVAGEVHIMVDVNHDGNFDPNVDMVIHVLGPKSNLVASDFHFS